MVPGELGHVEVELEAEGWVVLAGVAVRSLTTDRRSLEDAFVALTGEGFDVAR